MGEISLLSNAHGLKFQWADAGLVAFLAAWLWERKSLGRERWLFLLPLSFSGSLLHNVHFLKTLVAIGGL